jgi:hypothetical protein
LGASHAQIIIMQTKLEGHSIFVILLSTRNLYLYLSMSIIYLYLYAIIRNPTRVVSPQARHPRHLPTST